MPTNHRFFFIFFATVILALAGCRGEENNYIVKVGESKLTAGMIDSALSADVRDDIRYRQQYAQEWVRTEVLYQKALEEGYEKDERYQRQIHALGKQVLVQLFMEDEMKKNLKIEPREVERFYKEHIREFSVQEDLVKAEYFFSKDVQKIRALTRQFRSLSRLRKKDFMEIVQTVVGDSDIVGTTDFLPRGQFDERTARFLFQKSATDDVIGPLSAVNGQLALWHVLEIRPKNTPRPIEEVAPEIEGRLIAIKRKQLSESIAKTLRAQASIDYRLNDSAGTE